MNEYLLPTSQRAKHTNLSKFIEATRRLADERDNRGKRHSLPLILSGVTLAILCGRATLSSIQRYMANRNERLPEVTGEESKGAVSRAQLPRILSKVDRAALNVITQEHFGVHLVEASEGEWKAIDGKTLRGTTDAQGKERVRIVTAVDHTRRETVAQAELTGAKKSEITAVRTFLQATGLERANTTLDALHLNPTTTAQIEQAGGHYIIQAKRNQPTLADLLTTVAHTQTPRAILNTSEIGHGRNEERWAWFFDLAELPLPERWQLSGLRTLTVVLRQTTQTRSQQTSLDLSYYLSNSSLSGDNNVQPSSLFHAIRCHWGIESLHWVRDVTFQEDRVHTKDANLAQLLASLRTFAISLLQRAQLPNFQAALERFTDCPHDFLAFLHDSRIL